MAQQLHASIVEERQAVRSKNELITNVSHDIRTPLTSMIGYLRWIEEDRYQDEVELRHYVNIVYEKSLRLERLVNDLFEYTRMSSGQIRLQRADIDLVELLNQLAAEFTLLLRDSPVQIHPTMSEKQIHLHADGDKLMRLFENLIDNAIKYGYEGEEIRIVTGVEAQWAVVRIVNYGPQIPPIDLPHLFERMYRVEKSRSDATGGTGIGLAIAKSIVDLHGGEISVCSDEQETVFEVKLPLRPKDEMAAHVDASSPSHLLEELDTTVK